MKKRHHLAKILSVCSLALFLAGCTSLDYTGTDFETIKSAYIETDENFSLQTYEKSLGEQNINIGISETPLEAALVLYIKIQNPTDTSYKFNMEDVEVTSPIGDVSFIPPSHYIEAYQNYEAANYAGMVNAGAALSSFATLQNQYRQTVTNTQTNIENRNQSPELVALENTILGIQKHSITSYKFLEPNSSEYFYIFLQKPEEYPIVVKYKNLTYEFGGKKDAKE